MNIPEATPVVAPARSRLGNMPDSAGPTPPTAPVAGRAQEPLSASDEKLQVDTRLLDIEGAVAALLLEQTKLRARSAPALDAEMAAAEPHVGYDAVVRDEVRVKAESFGYPQPHDYQLDGVCSVLTGTHTAVIWPAGGGKGLLTLLLSAMLPGKVTLVIVPLVALANQLCDAVNLVWAEKHATVKGRERAIAEVLGRHSDADYSALRSTRGPLWGGAIQSDKLVSVGLGREYTGASTCSSKVERRRPLTAVPELRCQPAACSSPVACQCVYCELWSHRRP